MPQFTTTTRQHQPDVTLLRKRYLLENENTWDDLVTRVAGHPKARAESDRTDWARIIGDQWFIPSRMTYMGTRVPFASSCFVLPIDDSLDSIMQTLHDAATLQKFGGGTGYNFSRLRPAGMEISSTHGEASGPVSFMGLFHNTMEVVKRAGRKHSAQMGVLNVSHPDILEFIDSKRVEGSLWTFNISVGVTDEFMNAVERDDDWDLVWNGRTVKTLRAYEIWQKVIHGAWQNGEPGLIFLDTVSRGNLFPEPVDATNPCGEQPLPPYVSCNLGSINLGRFVENGKVAWDALTKTTRSAVRFLDASLDAAYWPVKAVEEKTRSYRNLGLGIMGLADMLSLVGVPYNSQEGLQLSSLAMETIQNEADAESRRLGTNGQRENVTLTTIAPTGSISFLADASSGCEPYFGLVTTRHSYIGSFQNVNWVFKEYADAYGFGNENVYRELEKGTPLSDVRGVPHEIADLFPVANEISAKHHVDMQAALQRNVDQAVSKTVNLANKASLQDVNEVFMRAWKTGCKSITVYRDDSREVQVLDNKHVERDVCPVCAERGESIILFRSEGCAQCPTCGYAVCEI